MLRRFLKDAGIYGLSRIGVQALSLFLVPAFTRVLTPEEYGTLDLLTVFGALAGVTVALEVSQGMARHFAGERDHGARVAYASTSLWFTVLAYGLFLAAVLASAPLLARSMLGSAAHAALLRVAAVAIAVNGVFRLVQSQLRWDLKPGLYTTASLVYTLLALVMAVVLVVGLRIGVVGYFWGQIAAGIAGVALAVQFARHSYRFVFEWRRLRDMLSFSLPLVPSSVAVFATVYIDRVALSQLLSLDAVGLYGIAYRVATVGTLLLVGVEGALTPLIYTHFRDEGAADGVARVFRYFVAGALLLWLGIGVFARELLVVFTTPAYYASAGLVPLLVPTLLLLKMYVFAPGLDLAKRTGVTAAINVVAGGINTALNFLLIPRVGILGAAIGTFISAAFMFTAYMSFSQRHYPVPHDWRRLGLAVAATIPLIIIGVELGGSAWIRIPGKALLVLLAAATYAGLGLVEVDVLMNRGRRWLAMRAFAGRA